MHRPMNVKHSALDCSCFSCCGGYIFQKFCQQMSGSTKYICHNKQLYSEREIITKMACSAPANHKVQNLLNLQLSKYF